jgi:hypothetical protein
VCSKKKKSDKNAKKKQKKDLTGPTLLEISDYANQTFVNLRMFASSLSAGFGRVRKRGFLRIIPAHSTTRSPPLPRIEPHRPER